jgi:hypothetical protein
MPSESVPSRNRSEGWRHAKIQGHVNENELAIRLKTDTDLISRIAVLKFGYAPSVSPKISVDGSKRVDSILGDSTTSKTDISISWSDSEWVNLSVKMSKGGQVWLISVPRFISRIEHHLGAKLDPEVEMGLSLFIGGSNLSLYESLYKKALAADQKQRNSLAVQEQYQKRLLAESIIYHYGDAWSATINFFNSEIDFLTDLMFAKGLASNPSDFADIVIYNNADSDHQLFSIPILKKAAKTQAIKNPIKAGPRNGGSTIIIPTGFMQMHHPQSENLMQFHHKYEKVKLLAN